MKKIIPSLKLKSVLAFVAFLCVSLSSFAQTSTQDSLYKPDVYISRAPVSEISGPELLEKPWFWILIVVVVSVLLSALLAAKDKQDHEPHAL